jgi:hypothetical protein
MIEIIITLMMSDVIHGYNTVGVHVFASAHITTKAHDVIHVFGLGYTCENFEKSDTKKRHGKTTTRFAS